MCPCFSLEKYKFIYIYSRIDTNYLETQQVWMAYTLLLLICMLT